MVSRNSADSPVDLTTAVTTTNLPAGLEWLKTTTLELMIDQEGFRAVRPALRFAAWLPSADPHGIVEFRPIEGYAYKFHHSALDPDPVLRRLIRDGDELRDFLSRYGTLTLKSTGVYIVSGAEEPRGAGRPATNEAASPTASGPESPREAMNPPSSFLTLSDDAPDGIQSAGPHSPHQRQNHQQSQALRWTFEYAVDYVRSAKSGDIVPGEKAVTPVAFRCAPMVLHASAGTKVGIMTLAKKAARFNVVAQRIGDNISVAGSAMRSGLNMPDEKLPGRGRLEVHTMAEVPWALSTASEGEQAFVLSEEGGVNEDEKPLLNNAGRPSPPMWGNEHVTDRGGQKLYIADSRRTKAANSPQRPREQTSGQPRTNKANLSRAVSADPAEADTFQVRLYDPPTLSAP